MFGLAAAPDTAMARPSVVLPTALRVVQAAGPPIAMGAGAVSSHIGTKPTHDSGSPSRVWV